LIEGAPPQPCPAFRRKRAERGDGHPCSPRDGDAGRQAGRPRDQGGKGGAPRARALPPPTPTPTLRERQRSPAFSWRLAGIIRSVGFNSSGQHYQWYPTTHMRVAGEVQLHLRRHEFSSAASCMLSRQTKVSSPFVQIIKR
jgi:hypothetical protein